MVAADGTPTGGGLCVDTIGFTITVDFAIEIDMSVVLSNDFNERCLQFLPFVCNNTCMKIMPVAGLAVKPVKDFWFCRLVSKRHDGGECIGLGKRRTQRCLEARYGCAEDVICLGAGDVFTIEQD